MTDKTDEQKPVAWRGRDFADGWILFETKEAADRHNDATGAYIEPLFRSMRVRGLEHD